jgi:hypothetical protein
VGFPAAGGEANEQIANIRLDPEDWYSVVTDNLDKLVTSFPGRP